MTMMNKPAPVLVDGWSILAHPLLLEEIEVLIATVSALQAKNKGSLHKKSAAKRLKAIRKLMFEVVPRNPAAPEYRQGKTLGEKNTAWCRAKFFQQYRLFFRFHSRAKIIVFAWVNDDQTKRAYGSQTDAYRVFGHMLHSGRPPSDWDSLLKEAAGASERLTALMQQVTGSIK